MLGVLFFGDQTEILEELRRHARVVGVFHERPRLSRWSAKDLVLSHAGLRNRLRPIILRHRLFSKRWRRTLQKFVLYDYCMKSGLPVITAGSFDADELVRTVHRLHADLGVVANFGRILPHRLLASTRHGFINFHPSALPKYRGADPFVPILFNGDAESAVTWHRMVAQVDAGPVLCQERFSITDVDCVPALIRRSVERGKRLLGPLLQSIENGSVLETPQDEAQATYCSKLTRKERTRLHRIIRQKARAKTIKGGRGPAPPPTRC